MTTNHTREKAADVLAHVDGEASTYSEETMSQHHIAPHAYEIRLEDRRKSTGVDFATLAGDMLPMGEYMRVIVPKQAVRDACAAPTECTVSHGDAIEHNRRIRANRAKAEHRRRQQQRLLDMEGRIAAAADSLRINATDDDIAHAAAAALSALHRDGQEAEL